MQRAFQPDDLMAILDGIDDAVVSSMGRRNFAAMNQAAAEIYQRLGLDPPKHEREIRVGTVSGTERHSR